jgi:hypothetical protein
MVKTAETKTHIRIPMTDALQGLRQAQAGGKGGKGGKAGKGGSDGSPSPRRDGCCDDDDDAYTYVPVWLPHWGSVVEVKEKAAAELERRAREQAEEEKRRREEQEEEERRRKEEKEDEERRQREEAEAEKLRLVRMMVDVKRWLM